MDEDVKRSLRFPAALYERLQQIAEKEHRSVAAQIVKMLEEAVVQYEDQSVPTKTPLKIPVQAALAQGKAKRRGAG